MLEEILGMVSWAVQLLLASLAPLAALMVLESALNSQDTLVSQLLGYMFLAIVGAGLGLVVSVSIPASLRVGVWVWVLPVIIEIWAIISEGYSTGGLSSVGRAVSCNKTPSRRTRRGDFPHHLSNLELLLVFGSHVVASSPEPANRRRIHQLLADYHLAGVTKRLRKYTLCGRNCVVSNP
jgi:hypothetical protein